MLKKYLLILVLMIGMIFTTTAKLGAKMSNEFNQVRAAHILVASKQEADSLKQKIEKNEISFEEAAKQFSKCPSGMQGGDLGYFGRGMMVKEFEVASFDGEAGKVTEPVQTQFGWHLIKVIDKQ
ncbi:MAG: peptidyl-prolyl cis-trans isomerase [Candidatus Gastranaerophilales bacterium]|nr:peptidyl-prolyl cis-trans isomerase [Candidatus Gastranaerophilales bacterium]